MKCSVMFSTLLPCFNEQMCGFCSVFFCFSNEQSYFTKSKLHLKPFRKH